MKEKCQEKNQDKVKNKQTASIQKRNVRAKNKEDRPMNNAYFTHERMENNK